MTRQPRQNPYPPRDDDGWSRAADLLIAIILIVSLVLALVILFGGPRP